MAKNKYMFSEFNENEIVTVLFSVEKICNRINHKLLFSVQLHCD